MDHYGLDVHKKSITYVRMNGEGQVLRRGRVAVVANDIREIVAPSQGRALVAMEATGARNFVYDLLEPLTLGVALAHLRRGEDIATDLLTVPPWGGLVEWGSGTVLIVTRSVRLATAPRAATQ